MSEVNPGCSVSGSACPNTDASWMSISGDGLLIRRPNIVLFENCYCVVGTREICGALEIGEEAIWSYIGTGVTVKALRKEFPETADVAIHRFLELEICDVVPSSFPPSRRTIAVIEPHMDDAALSVGGTMWSRRNDCEFVIATVAGRSNYTMCYDLAHDFLDVGKVTRLRRDESEHFVRLIGGRHIVLNCVEAPLRYWSGTWTREWLGRHRQAVYAFGRRYPLSSETEQWISEIARFIEGTEAEEIWMPLGVGLHTDHQLVRGACLELLMTRSELFDGKLIRFYEDVPYAEKFPGHAEQIVCAMRKAGAEMAEERIDISEAIQAKFRMMSVFRSQYRMDRFGPRVEKCGRAAAPAQGLHGERRFRLRKPPSALVEPLDCHARIGELDRLMVMMKRWLPKKLTAKRIFLLLLTPTGRWESDMKVLMQVFPKALFHVFTSSQCMVETESFVDSRLFVHPVGSRSKVARFASRVIFSTAPIIVLSGDPPVMSRRIVRLLERVPRVVTASNLNHLVIAIHKVSGEMTVSCGGAISES